MRKYLIAAAALAATTAIGFSAQAGELKSKAMTDQQLDQVVAGQTIYAYQTNDGYAVQTRDFSSGGLKGKKSGWTGASTSWNYQNGTAIPNDSVNATCLDDNTCVAGETTYSGLNGTFTYSQDLVTLKYYWAYTPNI